MTENQICGTCKWHFPDDDGDWYCTNPDSDYYVAWTEYDDQCEEWEKRQ